MVRIDRRWAPIAAALLVLAPPAHAHTQFVIELGVGATGSSNLVTDVIVEEITARPAVAPTVIAAIGTWLDPRHTLHVNGAWTRSNVQRHQQGTTQHVVSLTTWHGSLLLRRHLSSRATAHATVGVLKYVPSSEDRLATLFRGSNPAFPTVGIGASLEHPVSSTYTVRLNARWDLHRFSTAALRNTGIAGRRTVHRILFGATIKREFGRARP